MLRLVNRRRRLLICAAVTLSACNDSTSPASVRPGTPPTKVTPSLSGLIRQDGDGQIAAPGAVLPRPLAVEAVTSTGTPLSGIRVVFRATEGGGAIAGDTVFTDAEGLAVSGAWTLGTAERQTATATAGSARVIFTATAFAADLTPLTSPDTVGPATANVSGQLAFIRADTLFVLDAGMSTTMVLRSLPLHSPAVSATALSPDRSQVAYVNTSSSDICVVAVAGSQVSCDGLNYHDLRRPAWSPDGRRLAFIGPVDVEHLDAPFPYPPDMRDAFVENLESFGLIGAGPASAGMDDVTDLAWSPDGQKLALTVRGQKIYSVKADGTGRKLIYYRPDVASITGVRWSPDGTSLVVTLQLSECNPLCDWGIAVVRLDGTGSRLLALAHGSRDKFLSASSWSPDGSAVAYSDLDCSRSVYSCRQDAYVVGTAGGPSRMLLSNAELVAWWR